MESWARRRQGKNLALNSFTPLPGYQGGLEGLYCMCSINGDSTPNVQRQRSNSPFWTGAQTALCTDFAEQYNSFNQSDEQLNAADENNQEIHDYRGPCAGVRRWIVYFAPCIRRVLTSHFDTFSKEKSMKVNVWWPCDVGEFEETLIYVITQSSGFGSQDVQLRSPEQSWNMMLSYCGYLMISGFQSIIHPY